MGCIGWGGGVQAIAEEVIVGESGRDMEMGASAAVPCV